MTFNDTKEKKSSSLVKTSKNCKRFLLIQLNSNGDCLYATAVAHQIKVDYPDCHLTWAISSMCRRILDLNPHIDEIWEIPLSKIEDLSTIWPEFEKEAWKRKANGDFDEIFITQFIPGYPENYDGLIRSSIFRGYPKPIQVPVTPIIRLSYEEVRRVNNFINQHKINENKYVILFECSPKSDQSFVNIDFALEVSNKIIGRYNSNMCIILSSNVKIPNANNCIIDGSALSLRENAELVKYCNLLIGCSSGITWITTSDWGKKIPMVQLLKAQPIWFASIVQDHRQWELPVDHIIEITECSSETVTDCITAIIEDNFEEARLRYAQDLVPTLNAYGYILRNMLIKLKLRKSIKLVNNHVARHGRKKLIEWHIEKAKLFFPNLIKRQINFIKKIVKKILIP
ncbi:hypothetical protein IQ225_06965 [Synechocystis salina LEGE 06155]|nr:hypothetical protein [Synechocystis salina LEGE 06155]